MTNLNDLILGQGDDARKAVEDSNKPKSKTNYIRLKSGESVRGYLLTKDFLAFMQHGDFNRKIHSHVCKDPRSGKDCISCKAAVPRSKVWLVPIYDIDAKSVRIFEAKKKYMAAVYNFVDEYEDEAITTPITLSRTGADAQSTNYSIMPTRVKANEKSLFELPENIEINEDFYMNILNPPSDEYLSELLGLNNETTDDEIVAIGDDETQSF
jgi:hypothetical protein